MSENETVKLSREVERKLIANARRGARLLDKTAGEWWNRIHTTKLEMEEACRCVYGQLDRTDLFTELRTGAVKLPGLKIDHPDNISVQVGYLPPYSIYGIQERKAAYDVLQEEWLRQIKIRRDAEKAAKAA